MQTQVVGSTLSPQWSRHSVDTRRRATAPAFFVYLTKMVFFSIGGKQRFYWSRHLVI